MKSGGLGLGVLLLVAAAIVPSDRALAAIIWQATSTNYWTNTTSWLGGTVPGPSDDVVFTNTGKGMCIINGDVTINSLNVATGYAATITFAQGYAAGLTVNGDLNLGAGTKILCPYVATNGQGTGRVITVYGNATIQGTVDASGQGFPLRTGPGYVNHGASHGGDGSGGFGHTYGSVAAPTALGSGGYNVTGGGAILIAVSNTLTVNGIVTADSATGGESGSGGSVWLICSNFAGTGVVSAVALGTSWGGGGGRLSLLHTNNSFTGRISVAASLGTSGYGEPGSLWEPGRFPSSGNITLTTCYQYYFPDNSTNTWNLTLAGTTNEFHGGSLVITNLLLTNGASLRFDNDYQGTFGSMSVSNLTICGSIVLSNSTLALVSAGTYALSGDLVVNSNSTLYAYGNTGVVNAASGGTTNNFHGIGTTIAVGGNARLDGIVNANNCGFPLRTGPGYAASHTGSHGGDGYSNSGKTYGQRKAPSALGSGGYTAAGGGAIQISVTNTLTVNGTISANCTGLGEEGSGGSVWLSADTLAGNGLITADTVGSGSYGGGGGRVALIYNTKTFTGIARAAGGSGTSGGANVGQPGTVYEPVGFPTSGDIVISQSGVWDLSGSTNTWSSLTISNAASVTLLNGAVTITNLTIKDGATLKLLAPGAYTLVNDLALTNGNLQLNNGTFAFNSLSLVSNCTVTVATSCTASISGSVTLDATSSLDLAKGAYAFTNVSVGRASTLYVPGQSFVLYALTVVSNAALYCRGDTGAVNVASGGTTNIPHGTGAAFRVLSDVQIDGIINADGQGFAAQTGPGGTSTGGSHGGDGNGVSGKTYGSRTAPTALGSGGYLGTGGGAIRLDIAGNLTVNGTISANSQNSAFAGSGGSVWLSCSNLAGTGRIAADSVNGSSYGGGGGRVSLVYNTKTYTGTVSAACSGSGTLVGQPGTICESGASFPASGNVTLSQSGHWNLGGGVFNWSQLTVSNGVGAWLENGTVTVAAATLRGPVWLSTGSYTFGDFSVTGGSVVIAYSSAATTITGALSVAGSSTFYLPVQTNNLTSLYVDSSCFFYPSYSMGVTNAANADSGGTTNSPQGVGVVFNVSGDATILGTMSVDNAGFANWFSGARANGPGFAGAHTASYGGKGFGGGPIYGQLTRPTALGSGGYNCNGGGALKLAAGGTLRVDGTITANSTGGESGSGGSLWLRAGTFVGGGIVRANAAGTSYAGGGGRVALEYGASSYTGAVQVATVPNPGNPGAGQPGTYYACQSVSPGSDSEGTDGVTLRTALSVNGGDGVIATNGVRVTRTVSTWRVVNGPLTWTDTSTDLGGALLTNVATYTLSGLAQNRRVLVMDNGAFYCATNSGVSGTVSFSVTLNGPQTINIPPPPGTIFVMR